MVNTYYNQLKQNPPRVPVRILVRNMGAGILTPNRRVSSFGLHFTDDQYAVIGGQHISGAMKKTVQGVH
jgi:hypothetical protein